MDGRRARRRRNWLVLSLAVIAVATILFVAEPAIFGVPVMWIFGS